MKLNEYEAKEIFRNNSIPVNDFMIFEKAEAVPPFAKNNFPVVIKAQVLTGGRGKAGGVKFAANEKEYLSTAGKILGMKIKGLEVKKILVEKKLDIKKELYLGFSILRSQARAVFMFSAKGGMDIEELARNAPEAIIKLPLDITEGFPEGSPDKEIINAGVEPLYAASVAAVARNLYNVFTEYECDVAEINPLVITEGGQVLAADARISIYDEALEKHPEYKKEEETYTELEKAAHRQDLGYVEMEGGIGVIGNGAGLNMATLDILNYFGGKPANFLEVSGRTYHKAQEAIKIVLDNPKVKVVFGNFFGCISRCNVIAEGLSAAKKNGLLTKPVVISMRGTGAGEGIETLKKNGFSEIYEDDIEAGRRAVELFQES